MSEHISWHLCRWFMHYKLKKLSRDFVRRYLFLCDGARCLAEVSICDDGILLECQTTGPFPGRLDSSILVRAAPVLNWFEQILKCYTFGNVALILATLLWFARQTELRWGGRGNFSFMRHTFLVATVKKWLKSVYIYQRYRKIKTGVSLFWTTLYTNNNFYINFHSDFLMPKLFRHLFVIFSLKMNFLSCFGFV